jgi:anaerobic selenocysteine-containing dehydrogenase
MNTSFANEPKLRRKLGAPSIGIHPADALARGVGEGDEVRVASETGALTLRVTLTDDVLPGVAYMPKGRWPRFEEDGANVNALVAGTKTDMGESTCVHATEVTLDRR